MSHSIKQLYSIILRSSVIIIPMYLPCIVQSLTLQSELAVMRHSWPLTYDTLFTAFM